MTAISTDPCFAFAVNAPNNVSHSNGIRVFLNAIQSAIGLGFKAVVVPTDQTHAAYLRLQPPYQDLPISWRTPEDSIVILGDTCCQERLEEIRARASQICHYSLAPLGMFSGEGTLSNSQLILPGERQAVYSPQVSTLLPHFYLQSHFHELERIPYPPKQLSRPIQASRSTRRLRVCIYAGKARLRPIHEPSLRRRMRASEATLITRLSPSSKEELYRQIWSADLLISFDPMSSLSHEAILLGTPTLVLCDWDEPDWVRQFPVCLDGIAWNNFSQALQLVDLGFDQAAVNTSYRKALARNTDQLMALMAYAAAPEPAPFSAAELNAYWAHRKDFLTLLHLPSTPDEWGPIDKALPPHNANEHLNHWKKISKDRIQATLSHFTSRCRATLNRLPQFGRQSHKS